MREWLTKEFKIFLILTLGIGVSLAPAHASPVESCYLAFKRLVASPNYERIAKVTNHDVSNVKKWDLLRRTKFIRSLIVTFPPFYVGTVIARQAGFHNILLETYSSYAPTFFLAYGLNSLTRFNEASWKMRWLFTPALLGTLNFFVEGNQGVIESSPGFFSRGETSDVIAGVVGAVVGVGVEKLHSIWNERQLNKRYLKSSANNDPD